MHTKHPDKKLSKIFAKNIQPNSLCSARGSEQKLIQNEYSEQDSIRERNEKDKLHKPSGELSGLQQSSKKQEQTNKITLSQFNQNSEGVPIETENNKINIKSFDQQQNQDKSKREQYPNNFSEFNQIGAEISPIKAMLFASQLYESIEIKPQNLSKSFNIELTKIENDFTNYDKQETNIKSEGSMPKLKNSKIAGSGVFYEPPNKTEEEPQLLQQQSTGNTAKKIKRLKKSLVFIIEKNDHLEYMLSKDNDIIQQPKLLAEPEQNQQNQGSEINNQSSRPNTQRLSTSKFSSIPLLDFQQSDQKVSQIEADSDHFNQQMISSGEYKEQLRFIHSEKQKFRRYNVLFQEFSQQIDLKKTYFLFIDFFRFFVYVALISTFYNYAKEVLCIILGVNVLFEGFAIAIQPFKQNKFLLMNLIFEILFDFSLLILLVYVFIEEKISTVQQKLTMGWVIIAIDLLFMLVLLIFCLKQLIGQLRNQYQQQQTKEEETLRPDLAIQAHNRNNGEESTGKKENHQKNTLN